MKKIILLIYSIVFITSCSKEEYSIDTSIINGKTYYEIDSKEDLIWLSNPELLSLKPIVSKNVFKFKSIQEKWNADFIQTKDIVLDTTIKNAKKVRDKKVNVFKPIGMNNVNFTGSYNGKGFGITNLHLNIQNEKASVGLFSVIENSTLDSICLHNVSITGFYSVGGVAGTAFKSSINNCYVSGKLHSKESILGGVVGLLQDESIIDNASFKGSLKSTEDDYLIGSATGGIVGYSILSKVINSNSSGKIEGISSLGGIVGCNSSDAYENFLVRAGKEKGSINNCSSSSSIIGESNLGGIIGSIGTNEYISECFFKGNISGRYRIGGIIGEATNTLISNCYNTGLVISTGAYAGGIVGEMSNIYRNEYPCIINESYNLGNVIGNNKVGGIVGEMTGNVINSYNIGNAKGNDYVGGIVGILESKSLVLKSYSLGEINGGENVGAIAGKVYGMTKITKSETDFSTLFDFDKKFISELSKLGIGINKIAAGTDYSSTVKNSYWNKSYSNIDKAIGEIEYSYKKNQVINGAKELKKDQFLRENSFNKKWAINTKDSIWGMEKYGNSNTTLPFLNWQKIIIQQVDDGKKIKNIVVNNKNKYPITKTGYLSSSDMFFNTKVDTLCVENTSIGIGSVKEIKDCFIKENSVKKYQKIFAQDDFGNIWYGKVLKIK